MQSAQAIFLNTEKNIIEERPGEAVGVFGGAFYTLLMLSTVRGYLCQQKHHLLITQHNYLCFFLYSLFAYNCIWILMTTTVLSKSNTAKLLMIL
jgi:hypothetical protein